MSSEAYKYWASNRGWISTKFSVKNPVSHFLNLYKKKQPQSKPQKSNEQSIKYFTVQKRRILTNHTQKVANSQKKVSIQPQAAKPQTAPHNYTINSCIFLGEQIQKKSKTIQHPKRNRSLHVKKAKKLQDEIKGLKQMNTVMTKIKQQNETNHYSQKNFKATNCGSYKRQMMYLQPQIRASTAIVKLNSSINAHEQFERRKTTIYKQINRSMDVDMKIRQMQQYQRPTSVIHYQPIQYMTEYGYQQGLNQQARQDNISAFVVGKEPKWGQTFRRKPNLSVLRNKLNLHYKRSDYKDKLSSAVKQSEMQQDLSSDAFD